MELIKTDIEDLVLLKPKVFPDERGYFMESYNKLAFEKLGLNYDFVQSNQSFSTRGVLRGLHFQKNPKAQTKLIRVLQGRILDVAVDIRKDSPTYGQYETVELSSENQLQFLIPKGFAHGFVVLSDTATIMYMCDEYYAPETEGGIAWDCPELAINWKLSKDEILVSDKDKEYSSLSCVEVAF